MDHLFVFAQSIMNTQLKSITNENMKKEMKEQTTSDGFIEDTTPELLLGYNGIFKSWNVLKIPPIK